MIKKEDVLVEGSDWLVSLTKITGKQIKDIQMYPSMEFGDVTFKLCWVIFEDGSALDIDGEHDFPYVTDSYKHRMLPDDDTMYDLYKQLNEEEED